MSFARTDRSPIGEWWWTVDRWSVVAILCLIVIGAIMSLAASPAIAEKLDQPSFHYVYRNLLFLIPSIGVLLTVSMLSPRQVRRLALIVFVISLMLMVLTLFIGPEVKGARRWIRLGSFSLQASEFMKPAFVVLAAWFLAEHNRNEHFPGNLMALALFAVVAVLLLRQPGFWSDHFVGPCVGDHVLFVWGAGPVDRYLGVCGHGGCLWCLFLHAACSQSV